MSRDREQHLQQQMQTSVRQMRRRSRPPAPALAAMIIVFIRPAGSVEVGSVGSVVVATGGITEKENK